MKNELSAQLKYPVPQYDNFFNRAWLRKLDQAYERSWEWAYETGLHRGQKKREK